MLFAGIDGGATSTRAIITNEEGQSLSREKSGRSGNTQSEEGIDLLNNALKGSIKNAYETLKTDEPIQRVCLGLTGVIEKNESNVDRVTNSLSKLIDFRHIHVFNDMRVAFEGATTLGDGVLVYGGTGSNSFARDGKGNTVTDVGGWGPIIDDEGGAFVIGKEALKRAARSNDGRGKRTTLEKFILEHFNAKNFGEVQRQLNLEEGLNKRDNIGRLAQLVAREAKNGDKVSINIMKKAGLELGKLVVTVTKKLGVTTNDSVDIFYSGGVFKAGKPLFQPFKVYVKENIERPLFKKPNFSPVKGAVLLTLKKEFGEVTKGMLNNLKHGE